MKTGLKELNSYTRELNVTVEWKKLSEQFTSELKKAQSTYDLKGFRKGRVPLNIVKKNLLPSIEAHFAEHSLNDYYKKALDEHNLNPINQAQIKKLHFHEGSNLEFTAEFEITPDVKLPNFEKKFKIKTTLYTPTSTDIEMALKDVRERHSTIKTIENGAKTGHFINGDFQELDENGNDIKGKKLENQYIKLGEAAFVGDAEKPFFGSKKGDSVTTNIKLDDKSVSYHVLIKKVEEQILPNLDDEFAVLADPDVKTMGELENKVESQIQDSLNKEHEKEVQKEIMDFFVKKSKLDAPKSMVDNYLSHIIEDIKKKDPNKQDLNEEQIKKSYTETAEWSVKWYLIKDAIISSKGIDVSKKKIQEKIDDFIDKNPKQKKEIKKFYSQNQNREKLFEDLLNEELFNYLKQFSTNKVTEKSTSELKKGKK